MSLADWLPGRRVHGRRLPERIDDLRGPAKGVIMLPRHLSWPGMRECDVTDDATRRNMYGIVLTQGQRNDVARFLNPELLQIKMLAHERDVRLTAGVGANLNDVRDELLEGWSSIGSVR